MRQTRKYADVRQRAICAERVEEVLNRANQSDQPYIQDSPEDTNLGPPTKEDIAAAIKEQPTKEKASGRDQIISFNLICEKTVRTNWSKSIIVKIPKKADLSSAVDNVLRKGQAGFRK